MGFPLPALFIKTQVDKKESKMTQATFNAERLSYIFILLRSFTISQEVFSQISKKSSCSLLNLLEMRGMPYFSLKVTLSSPRSTSFLICKNTFSKTALKRVIDDSFQKLMEIQNVKLYCSSSTPPLHKGGRENFHPCTTSHLVFL